MDSREALQSRYWSKLGVLLFFLLLLAGHLLYLVLTNPVNFPINTVKISATYQHITRSELEEKLLPFLQLGFFGLSTKALKSDLLALVWSHRVLVEREWPDTLKITLQEKIPIAFWNKQLLTADGVVFQPHIDQEEWVNLPRLNGPDEERMTVLKTFNELSPFMQPYGLRLSELNLRANSAWDAKLTNGSVLHLGKQDLLGRIKRFCRAYPAVFAEKSHQIATVDLRYAHGMAVEWKP